MTYLLCVIVGILIGAESVRLIHKAKIYMVMRKADQRWKRSMLNPDNWTDTMREDAGLSAKHG